MPYPSSTDAHPVRRWILTGIFTVVIFAACYGLVTTLESLDRETAHAHYEAEVAEARAIQNEAKALAQSIKQQNLCGVIAYLVERSNASLPSIDYYRKHPDELRAAQEANQETLRILDCRPIVPPPAAKLMPERVPPVWRGPH